MFPRVKTAIEKYRERVAFEAVTEGGRHAGAIMLKAPDGSKELLAKTDPSFDTAEEAIETIRAAVENGVGFLESKGVDVVELEARDDN